MTAERPSRSRWKRLVFFAALLAALFVAAVVFDVTRTPVKPRVLPGIPCIVVGQARALALQRSR
jgi:hypothetical protein